ncbi:hypothetical protein HPB47_016513, partial [Ixodes persulcatus]
HFDVCKTCGKLGHRLDVCLNPGNKSCFGCGMANPEEGYELKCQPKCKLCGGPHPTGERGCKNKYKMPYIVKRRQWERKAEAAEQQAVAGDFPPIRAAYQDDEPTVGAGKSVRKAKHQSPPRHAVKTTRSESKQPSVNGYYEKKRQEDLAAMKAHKDENDKLKRRISEQDDIIKEINAKLAILIGERQQQAPQPVPEKTTEILVGDESETEVDPRADRATEPAPKKRAIESIRDRKIMDKLKRHDERLDRMKEICKETSERLTSLEKSMQSNVSTQKLMELRVHNTLEEIAEAQRSAHLERLSGTKTGRKILQDLGINPNGSGSAATEPNRQAEDEGAVYVDAAEYQDRVEAYTAIVVSASTGAVKTAASTRTRDTHQAEEVAIALAIANPGCKTVLSDSRTAVLSYAKGRVCSAAARILRAAEEAGRQGAVVIKWFPAHMGTRVSGRGNTNHNETANAAARGLTNRATAKKWPSRRGGGGIVPRTG